MKPRVRATLALAVVVVLLWAVAAAARDLDRSGDTPEAASMVSRKTYLPLVTNSFAGCNVRVTLLGPANGASLNTLAPQFRWDAGSDPRATSSYLELSLEPDLAPLLATGGAGAQGEIAFRFWDNFAEGTTLYWRVYLTCGEARGPNTPVRSFTTGSGGDLPPAPSLLAPANGSTLSTRTVTLQWSPVSGAVEYAVFWRPKGAHYHTSHWVADTQTTARIYSGANEWWVAARNSYAIGADSPVWELTTPADAE